MPTDPKTPSAPLSRRERLLAGLDRGGARAEPPEADRSEEALAAVSAAVPAETPPEAPAASPAELPEADLAETPEAAPAAAPVEVYDSAPAEAPVEAPGPAPLEVYDAGPAETPEETPAAIPVEVLEAGPAESPAEPPAAFPAEVPGAGPAETPLEAPAAAPVEPPTADPEPAADSDEVLEVLAEAPRPAPARPPVAAPAEVPAAAPAAAPAEAPEEAPGRAPVRAATAALTEAFGGDSSQPAAEGPNIRGPVTLGLAVVFLFFGVFGAWAALAPLQSAAIAPGVVSVDSSRKTVQHLEGGIVGEILVREGDEVEAGQVLIKLDEVQASATRELLRGRLITATSLQARLEAERRGKDGIDFPDWLAAETEDATAREVMAAQYSIFEARRESLRGQVAILEQRISQFDEEIGGLEGQIAAEDRQIRLIAEEVRDLQTLVEKGLARRPRLLELERQAAEIQGSRHQNQARLARVRQQIGEAKLRISELRTQRDNEIVEELREVQSELLDLTERMRAASDVLARTEIRAPISGTVVGLQVHTAGGVIAPRERLMDIVPSEDSLIVEARVNPVDIDVVRQGLLARVMFSAFSQRNQLPIDGIVNSVSADSLLDDRSGESYYLARVALTGDVRAVLEDAELTPGMQADVIIVTGERTALQYLMKPLVQSFNRALREE